MEKWLEPSAAKAVPLQNSLAVPPSLEGYDIAGMVRPARMTGGDHVDYFRLADGQIGFLVADVSGRGEGPIRVMADTVGCMRALANSGGSLQSILEGANRAADADASLPSFVTAFLGCLDPATRRWTYISAGHAISFVLGSSGAVKARMEPTALPLAVLPDTHFTVSPQIQLEPGDTVLLLSDGVLENRTAGGEPFGEPRVLASFRAALPASPATSILERLFSEACRFAGGEPADDLAAIAIRVL